MTDMTLEAVLGLTKLVDRIDSRLAALEVNQAQEVKAESEAVDTSWPQVGDAVCLLQIMGDIDSIIWSAKKISSDILARGLVFRTKKEAEKADQLRLAMNELKVMAEQDWLRCDRVFDHTTSQAKKFSCSYDCLSLVWLTNYHINATVPGVVYFPTEASSIKAYEAVDAKYPGVLR